MFYFSVFGDIEGCMVIFIDKEWLIILVYCLYLGYKVIFIKFVKVEFGVFFCVFLSYDLVLYDVLYIVIYKDFNVDWKVFVGNIVLVCLIKLINVIDEIRFICILIRMEVEKFLKFGVLSDGVVIGWGKIFEYWVCSIFY